MTIALITGASSGIGAVYARRLAARGHDLVLVARATDRLETLAAELRQAYGIAVENITADLTDPTQLGTVAERLKAEPSIDILVNNAGAGLLGGFMSADPAAMETLLRLNVVATTLLASAVIAGMVERGSGSIVNIASVLALLPEYSPGLLCRHQVLCADNVAEPSRRSLFQGRIRPGCPPRRDTYGNLRAGRR
jgi:short-subunit dehydrogenase